MATKQQTISCYQGGWNKATTIDVAVGASGKVDDGSIHIQSIIRKSATQLYGYTSLVKSSTRASRIGLLISNNDGDTWTRYASNDGMIIDAGTVGSGYEFSVFGACAFMVGSKFHMIFCGNASEGAPQSWWHATSDDGIAWTIGANPILTPGLTYDALQMIPGHGVVEDNGTYYMPYTCQSSEGAASGSIAMVSFTVVNDVITGITKHGIVLSPRAGEYDASLLEPCLRVYGTKKYMFYQGDNLANPENFTCICVAICDTFTGTYVHQTAINPIVYAIRNTFESRWNETPTVFTKTNGTERMMIGAGQGLDDTSIWLQVTHADFALGVELIYDLSQLSNDMWDLITTADNIKVLNSAGAKVNRIVDKFDKGNKVGYVYVGNTCTTPSLETFIIQTGDAVSESNNAATLTDKSFLTYLGFDEASGAVVDLCGNYSGKTMTGTQNQTGLIGKAARFATSGQEYNTGVITQIKNATKLQILIRIKATYSGALQNGFLWWNDNWVTGLYFTIGGQLRWGFDAGAANAVGWNVGAGWTPWLVGDILSGWHNIVATYDGSKTGNTGRAKISIDGYKIPNYAESTGTIPAQLADNTGYPFHVGSAGSNNIQAQADVDYFAIRTSFVEGDEVTNWNNARNLSTFWTMGAVESVSPATGGLWLGYKYGI